MPGQGAQAMWKFSGNYHGIRMALLANNIPFETVSPQKWQKFYNIKKDKNQSKTQHKNKLKAKAQELFPNEKITLKNADALLIAYYGKQNHK